MHPNNSFINRKDRRMLIMKQNLKWTNSDLSEYYENIPVEELKKFTVIGGFNDGCDVELIRNYIKNAKSILDAGAGYGRVTQNILENGYLNNIVALERSSNFCDHMKKSFTQYGKRVRIVNTDIRYYDAKKKFDLILFMWSNISEFIPQNQLKILRNLKLMLIDGGALVVEIIDHRIKPKNSISCRDQEYVVRSEYGTAYGYLISLDTLKNYAEQIGFSFIKQIPYTTSTNRKRAITIMR